MTQPVPRAAATFSSKGKERRRWPRYPLRLSAFIEINRRRVSCVALNFCREGMFLKFIDSPPSRFEAVTITVILSGQNRISDYRIPARVVRQGECGIGIQFQQSLPEDLLQWLQQLSEVSSELSTDQAGPDLTQLRSFVLSYGNTVLTQSIEDFHTRIEDHLLQCADKAGSNADSSAFWEAATLFKNQHPALLSETLRCFKERTERFFTSSNIEDPSTQKARTDSLALIDQSDFEDWLNVTETAAPLETLHQDVLRRLEFLLQTHINRDQLAQIPFCPTFLGECFRSALDRFRIDSIPVRKTCYQLFFSCLRAPFGQAIDQAKKTFHIDVDQPLIPIRTEGHAHAQKHDTAQEETNEASSFELPPKEQPTAAHPVSKPGIISGLEHLLCDSENPEDSDCSTQLQQVERLLEQAKALPLDENDEELLQHLQSLARQSGQSWTLLNNRLQQRLIVANRLTRALAFESGHADIGRLERLRTPLLRLILKRPELFEASDSPAVDLINQLGKAEQWASEDTDLAKALDRYLDSLGEQLQYAYKAEPEPLLAQAQHQLQQILQPAQKKRERFLQRLIDGYVGRQRIAQAKLAVYRALHRRLSGEPVAEPLVELLKAGWFHLLVLTHLSNGANSPQWNERLEIIERLHRWLAAPEATHLPAQEVHTLLNIIDSDLESIGNNVVRHHQLLQTLSDCLLGPKQGERRRALPKTALSPEPFVDRFLLGLGRTSIPKELQSLTVGEWIKIQKNGKSHPFRLVWIGTHPPLYLFVDESGLRKLELKPKQLALLFRNHTATRIRNLDLPLLDRATERVFNELIDKPPEPSYDAVTGLIDRKTFFQNLRYALRQTGFPQERHIVCQLELDLLHIIASVCSQDTEEALLRHVTDLLKANIPEHAIPARLRDNVFAILLTDHSLKDALQVAQTLRRAFSQTRFRHGDQDYSLDVYIGLIPFSWGDKPDAILLNANATCLKAKKRGRNSIEVYKTHDEDIEKEKNMLIWAGRINRLFNQNRLFLRCQKIAPIHGEAPGHYEILIGAKDNDGKPLPPDKFIPAIEHFKRGAELDRWVVDNTLEWMASHRDRLEKTGGFSINLSGQSILDPDFQAFLEKRLSRHQDIIDKLTFEITETAAVGSFEQAARFIRSFKRLGCHFSLDDFGTGYASYAYLKHLEFDYLKIDGSFIRPLLDSPTDEEIVKSMNHIGHSLGLRTIAEYVENEAILAKLQRIGLDYAQGYYIGRPIPLDELSP